MQSPEPAKKGAKKMTNNVNEGGRDRVGFGSSYRKGTGDDLRAKSEIGAVLGGQVWMIKPDKDAKTPNPCLWMQAGIVDFKNCNNFYDCTTCKYDQGMSKQVRKGKQTSWQEAMRRKPSLQRLCRHTLTNRIGKRVCAFDYECSKCDFDQFFEDVWTPKTTSQQHEIQTFKGFRVPMGCYIHSGHTWARIESGGYIRVGMDDFAMKLVGKPDTFELPLMGKEVSQGKAGWGLKREVNATGVLSPIDGVIVEVNAQLRDRPELANREPYGTGWLFVIRNSEMKNGVASLMDEPASRSWMAEEIGKLEGMIEGVDGFLAADGGYITDDIFGSLPALGWKNLTRTFLRTE
jgi:glycine cleavage system H lipoate-binding protein